ncbi:TIM barrel protein [Methanobrevibacter sp. DSM 116169]|uniref:TIM barrel protein n=1 Tax=Methanobrevibacter sp. DSM 116169 TaxID=3242727 RepID=UPI0038FCA9C5
MLDKVIFGPAGKPIDFKGKAFESSEYLNEHGLHAFEYQSTYGVKIGETSAKILKEESKKENVLVSMHGPYYINLASKEEEKIDSSIERLIQSAKAGEWMGAYRIVFHPGFYSNRKKEKVLEIANSTIKKLLNRCEEEGLYDFTFAPETTGKRSQLGNLDEIISMCETFDHFEPTIDFAHIHARGRGILNTKEDYNCIFSKLENNLDIDRLHCHFTTIEYTHAGERKHHTLAEENEYGPHIKDLLLNLIENDWKATIICETPLIDQDAVRMRELYESLK